MHSPYACLQNLHFLSVFSFYSHFVSLTSLSFISFTQYFLCFAVYSPSPHPFPLSTYGGRGGHPQVSGERGYPWLSVCYLTCFSVLCRFFYYFFFNLCSILFCDEFLQSCVVLLALSGFLLSILLCVILWLSGFCQWQPHVCFWAARRPPILPPDRLIRTWLS